MFLTNIVLMVSLGLDTNITWLGLVKDPLFATVHHFFHTHKKKPEHSRLHSQALKVWGVFEELWVMAAAM